jgi:hypothetical protein
VSAPDECKKGAYKPDGEETDGGDHTRERTKADPLENFHGEDAVGRPNALRLSCGR